jgi:hypothetical protein
MYGRILVLIDTTHIMRPQVAYIISRSKGQRSSFDMGACNIALLGQKEAAGNFILYQIKTFEFIKELLYKLVLFSS